MKILVDLNGTIGTVTFVPSWLGRMFGRKAKRGDVQREPAQYNGRQIYVWCWRTTGRIVESSVERAIEMQEVADLPRAREVKTTKGER